MKCIFFVLCVITASVTATQTYLSDDSNGGADCTTDAECNAPIGGICEMGTGFNASGICVCTEKYTDPFCSYEMRSKSAAAGLQWLCLIGVGGVGNFYIGRIGEGVGQFILCLGFSCVIIGICCVVCGGSCSVNFDGPCGIAIGVIIVGAMVAGLIWSLVDFGMMLDSKVMDGNGYPLYPIK